MKQATSTFDIYQLLIIYTTKQNYTKQNDKFF